MIPSIEFMSYAHQCYLDKIIDEIKKQAELGNLDSFQIDVPEDLSENDLKNKKKNNSFAYPHRHNNKKSKTAKHFIFLY